MQVVERSVRAVVEAQAQVVAGPALAAPVVQAVLRSVRAPVEARSQAARPALAVVEARAQVAAGPAGVPARASEEEAQQVLQRQF